MKVFVDTNVIIDYLGSRKHHTKYANELFERAGESSVMLYVCSFSFAIVYHYLRKRNIPHRVALSTLDNISKRTRCLPVDDSVIKQAMKSGFTDFEDAIQHYCALQNPTCEVLLTRNEHDYKESAIPVMNPEHFLKTFSANNNK